MIIIYYFLLTQSILAACVIGVIKYPEMNPVYRPFLFACCADLMTEIIVFLLIRKHIIPYPVTNLYILISSLIFLWQFQLWGMFRQKNLFRGLIAFQCAIWFIEHFITDSMQNVTPYYRIESSFLLVILSVSTINKELARYKGNMVRNTQFIICTGLIIFFTYSIFVEVIYLKHEIGANLMGRVFNIKQYVNVFTNVLFAFAMLWVPVKKKYTMLF